MPLTAPLSLAELPLDHSALRELPLDPELRNFRRQVRGAALSRVQPTPVAAPKLVAWAAEVAGLLDLPAAPEDPELYARVLSGNQLTASMAPFASCYGGHQFGRWAGQLGDGRAITLGERVNHHGQRWELQLKGAGPTPYSRGADGRAVLRSSIREFLCSEAMFHLGVPTTRALSLVTTGEPVMRDMFYDGRPQLEPGAIVCRVAPSFFRIGHLQLPAVHGDPELLRALVGHVLRRHYPHLLHGGADPADPHVLLGFFAELAQASARLVVDWQRVGFVHGVMNTDNTSLLGLTIDYGPYGWLEPYDPDWTPNTTDAHGRRYRFGAQPQVMAWNLAQLAQVLVELGCPIPPLQEALQAYGDAFEREFLAMSLARLDLPGAPGDQALLDELWPLLQSAEIDYLLWFRGLADLPTHGDADALACVAPAFYAQADLQGPAGFAARAWLSRYRQRLAELAAPDEQRRQRMNRLNPLVVPRNWLVQTAIDQAEQGDFSGVERLLQAFARPYDVPADPQLYARRPEWARQRAGCSMLSCSS